MRLISNSLTAFLLFVSLFAGAQNPYLPLGEFIPDGEPYVFEDPDNPGQYRIFIYGSHDVLKDTYCGRNQVVWSASVDNPSVWRYDGICFECEGDILYAPDIVEIKGKDGKKLYYYYPNNQREGRKNLVAVGDSPYGPFKVCNWSQSKPGTTEGVLDFDPAVFQDDDGRVYGYWGFCQSYCVELDPSTMATAKPGAQVVCDMISGKDQLGEFRFFEASSMRKIKDKYVLVYSRWTADGEFGLPGVNYTLAYAYADNPTGPFTYGGTLIDCRGREKAPDGTTRMTANPYGNTHGSIAKVKDQWYVFYHRQTGTNEFSRQAMVSPINVEVVEGPDGYVKISEAEYTSEGFALGGLDPFKRYPAGIACYYTNPGGVRQEFPNFFHSGSYPEPYRSDFTGVENPYEPKYNNCPMVNNTSGSIVGYKYFNFDAFTDGTPVKLILAYVPQGVAGKMDIFIDSPYPNEGGILAGTLTFNGSESGVSKTAIIEMKGLKGLRGKHSLFFVFSSPEKGKSICRLDELRFTSLRFESKEALVSHAIELMDRIDVLDTHCDFPEVRFYHPERGYDIAAHDAKNQVTIPKMKKGHMSAIFMAAWMDPIGAQTDSAVLAKAPAYLWDFMDKTDAHFMAYPELCGLARTSAEIKALKKEGKIAFIYGLENAFWAGNDLENLKKIKERGFTYITLTHWGDNQVCHSCDQSADPSLGLTQYGRKFVAEMNRLGLIIDLSHTSAGTWKDVLEVSKAPVVFTHSGSAAVFPHQRNVDDETLRLLAANGGVIQVPLVQSFLAKDNFAKVGLSEMLDHIDHIVKVAGIDHVGIGMDFEGGGGGYGFYSADQAVNLTVALIERGYSDQDIEKIWGGNFLRVMDQVQALVPADNSVNLR